MKQAQSLAVGLGGKLFGDGLNEEFLIEDDGLPIPEIRRWAEEKYRLVSLYATLFARSMRNKWESLVYLDLFAAAGYGRIRGTRRIVLTSALRVVKMIPHFNRYIFTDRDISNTTALEQRVVRSFPDRDIRVRNLDVNTHVPLILRELPEHNRVHTVLAFCFLDPFNMKNLCFRAIEELSSQFMDFLILIPSGVEARNESKFMKPDNVVVEDFCGNHDWRDRWEEERRLGTSFEIFLTKELGRSMERLGYINPGVDASILVRSDQKRLPLYRLALYSRHAVGSQFWKQTKKYSDPQRNLFEK